MKIVWSCNDCTGDHPTQGVHSPPDLNQITSHIDQNPTHTVSAVIANK